MTEPIIFPNEASLRAHGFEPVPQCEECEAYAGYVCDVQDGKVAQLCGPCSEGAGACFYCNHGSTSGALCIVSRKSAGVEWVCSGCLASGPDQPRPIQ